MSLECCVSIKWMAVALIVKLICCHRRVIFSFNYLNYSLGFMDTLLKASTAGKNCIAYAQLCSIVHSKWMLPIAQVKVCWKMKIRLTAHHIEQGMTNDAIIKSVIASSFAETYSNKRLFANYIHSWCTITVFNRNVNFYFNPHSTEK